MVWGTKEILEEVTVKLELDIKGCLEEVSEIFSGSPRKSGVFAF